MTLDQNIGGASGSSRARGGLRGCRGGVRIRSVSRANCVGLVVGLDDVRTKLEHELADVLWSIISIATLCEIDLQASFSRTMDEIESLLTKSGGPRAP